MLDIIKKSEKKAIIVDILTREVDDIKVNHWIILKKNYKKNFD